MESNLPTTQKGLSWPKALLLVAGAALAFQLAYTFSYLSFLITVYLWCLFKLTFANTGRQAFYCGLVVGYLCGMLQAGFMWRIFGPAAIALWFVLAFWTAMFVALGRLARLHFGVVGAAVLIPFLWTGLEYFRSELYYLRFSWLNVGYVFATSPNPFLVRLAGMYGVGFIVMALIVALMFVPKTLRTSSAVALLALFGLMTNLPRNRNIANAKELSAGTTQLQIAGVQMEFPSERQVLWNLDKLAKKYPHAQLLLLSEYTVAGPLPDSLKDWCRKNHKYLLVGAEEPASGGNYYDTAFVIDPSGEIVFRQGKSVPIQFFKDGLPAKEQKLWNSPWGKIGFCVCYDLSYTRVTDELIQLGAQAIIVPTMDLVDWGRHQHELHARVAPTRVAEYGVPIFRLASSGISQFIDGDGMLLASAPMPGDEAMLYAPLDLAIDGGHLPWDRYLAPFAVAITGLAICWFVFRSFVKPKPSPPQNT